MNRSLYLIFIIVGYTLGIWTFTVIPKIYMTIGLKGLVLMLVFSAVVVAGVLGQINSIKEKTYRIHEFMVKSARLPAVSVVLVSFLFFVSAVVAHYTGLAVEKLFGIGAPGFGLIIALVAMIILIGTRGRSLDAIAIFSILLIILIIISVFFLRSKVSEVVVKETSREFVRTTLETVFSFSGELNMRTVVLTFLTTLMMFGLGVGFYYIIGMTISGWKFDIKKVLAVVVILQALLSLSAALILTYSIGAAHQAYWSAFEKGKAMEALDVYDKYFLPLWREYTSPERMNFLRLIDTVYGIPDILRKLGMEGGTYIIAFLMISLFFAGFTTLLVLIETGGQIISDMFQVTRKNAILIVSIITGILSTLLSLPAIKEVLVVLVALMLPLFALIESLPALKATKGSGKVAEAIFAILIAIFFIVALVPALQSGGDVALIGIVLGFLLLSPLVFNNFLLKSTR
ncbi:hypothetical protein PFDSM3638_06295 [Pyrococcus furiosus DSM 3638]|uniref:Uncharacterized protein n=3 Tax=Pyrococcus furiosus TaxID=2261 RepID=A0A5C0XQS5_PYRFU|nr:sodium-dependent transporter [Pyrococcus furiosus]AAL81387.1 hypothetical protein PF1263 [Pyrococcus furiosus DSM 3638]AFN04047.1 hypothetical protein PFC_05530 [Pyrococcus furiosus COM1]QEK78905.1 hypothetical protein PFDSM3638_06295 [Pyrococcus furiosus DSM 3638]